MGVNKQKWRGEKHKRFGEQFGSSKLINSIWPIFYNIWQMPSMVLATTKEETVIPLLTKLLSYAKREQRKWEITIFKKLKGFNKVKKLHHCVLFISQPHRCYSSVPHTARFHLWNQNITCQDDTTLWDVSKLTFTQSLLPLCSRVTYWWHPQCFCFVLNHFFKCFPGKPNCQRKERKRWRNIHVH